MTLVVSRLVYAMCFALIAPPAFAQMVTGTATYRERMALPPGALFEAVIEDVSRADAPALTLATTRIMSPGNPPIAFTITYDPARVLPDRRYVVRARIVVGGQLMFTTDMAIPVITRGGPTNVSLMLRRVGSTQTGTETAASGSGVSPPLEGTLWKATELAGKPLAPRDATREANLVFEAGNRVSGSDGCNRVTGTFARKGTDGLAFGQMAGTQKACLDTGEMERNFRAALKSASRWRIEGGRFELFDAAGARVAAFTAGASPPNADALQGTRWQLVRFQGSDGTTLTPDDPGKYTIEFGSGGQLNVRVDCNRGRGTWKASGPQLQFGPLALTRAQCPPGSLHDQMVKQWIFIRSYVTKDGNLFLALMADGGIYEFEPIGSVVAPTPRK